MRGWLGVGCGELVGVAGSLAGHARGAAIASQRPLSGVGAAQAPFEGSVARVHLCSVDASVGAGVVLAAAPAAGRRGGGRPAGEAGRRPAGPPSVGMRGALEQPPIDLPALSLCYGLCLYTDPPGGRRAAPFPLASPSLPFRRAGAGSALCQPGCFRHFPATARGCFHLSFLQHQRLFPMPSAAPFQCMRSPLLFVVPQCVVFCAAQRALSCGAQQLEQALRVGDTACGVAVCGAGCGAVAGLSAVRRVRCSGWRLRGVRPLAVGSAWPARQRRPSGVVGRGGWRRGMPTSLRALLREAGGIGEKILGLINHYPPHSTSVPAGMPTVRLIAA